VQVKRKKEGEAGDKIYDLKRRTYVYALDVIRVLEVLPKNYITEVLGKQLLRASTSVGANIVEAQASNSRRDFANYYKHSLRSANEAKFYFFLLPFSFLLNYCTKRRCYYGTLKNLYKAYIILYNESNSNCIQLISPYKEVIMVKTIVKTKVKEGAQDDKQVENEKVAKDKTKALDLALMEIEKQFGKGSIMRLGRNFRIDVPAISTGALSLDLAIGIGGVPRGRVIEVFGPESSGKTTLTLSIIAQAQKAGGNAAFIDAEHAFDAAYAKKLGINLDELLMSQPDTGEQALEIAETLVRSNALDVIAIDSVAALTPRAELEGQMGQSHVGLQARLMSQALRKLTGAISKSKTCIIFINQIREKIGIMFGNPETTPGGRALKFYSSVRLDLRKISVIKKGDVVVGNHVRASVVKNKVAPPFKKAEFTIFYDEGISYSGSVIGAAERYGVITKSGAWYLYGEEKLGQGIENARQFLKENPKILSKIDKETRQKAQESAQ